MKSGAQEAHEAIERFLRSSRNPAVQEPGEKLLALDEGHYAVQVRGNSLILEAWNDETNLARRITGIKEERAGRLELVVERFGKRPGAILLLDLARGQGEHIERRARRLNFSAQFRRFLRRQYPDWKIEELTTEQDLQHSLSPAYPRAFLRKGHSSFAAIAATGGPEADGVLTFGLIWLDYVRKRNPERVVEGLVLFVPLERAKNTCLRLRYLDTAAAAYTIYAHSEDGIEERIDPKDFGNIDTKLEVCAGVRASGGPTPEARLEKAVRKQIEVIEANLLPSPVYGQVPAIAGVDRGIIDLLAAERNGQLAVLELKATQDPHLPLQALDYWIRVKWHAERGEFGPRGYFPGIIPRNDAPRLFLVAPALEFHPTSETVLRYFSSHIEVERVGLAIPWEDGLRVMFRTRGAQAPELRYE